MNLARYVLGTSVLVGAALLLTAGGALANSGIETEASRTHEIHQDVDLDEDEVLLGLALGGVDIADIADIERSVRTSSDLSRDVDLDQDDVLAALVLDNGWRRGLGNDAMVRTIVLADGSDGSRVHIVNDDFDRLGTRGFGTSGLLGTSSLDTFGLFGDLDDFEDIADFDSESEVSVRSLSNVDLDTDDALLALALR